VVGGTSEAYTRVGYAWTAEIARSGRGGWDGRDVGAAVWAREFNAAGSGSVAERRAPGRDGLVHMSVTLAGTPLLSPYYK